MSEKNLSLDAIEIMLRNHGEMIREISRRQDGFEKDLKSTDKFLNSVTVDIKMTHQNVTNILLSLEKLEKSIDESNKQTHDRITSVKDEVKEMKNSDIKAYSGYKKLIATTIIQLLIGGTIGALVNSYIRS